MLKLCKDCQSFGKEVMETPHGPQYMPTCKHEDCCDVITGSPIPAMMARQQEVYCGFKARYYKKLENAPEDAKIVQLVMRKE